MAIHIRRQEFIGTLGSATAWPLAARAQQPAMPVIGFIDTRSVETTREQVAAFKRGLAETGYVEGRNVAIEYRWADNQTDRLPALASDLVRQRVAVIVAPGPPSALAAKAATTTIPIVFTAGEDPVRLGLVASLARPGGNLTGINWFGTEVTGKRLELLRELVPAAARVVLLVQPSNVNITELTVRNVETAARAIGVQVQVPTRAVRSMRRSRLLIASDLMLSSSAPAAFSTPDVSNWPNGRRTTECPRPIQPVNMSRPAGL